MATVGTPPSLGSIIVKAEIDSTPVHAASSNNPSRRTFHLWTSRREATHLGCLPRRHERAASTTASTINKRCLFTGKEAGVPPCGGATHCGPGEKAQREFSRRIMTG